MDKRLLYEYIDPEEQIASADFQAVESFLKGTGRTQIGWHYITDLVWLYGKVKNWPRGIKVLDAGGGTGPTQFLLLELGFHVVNIDLLLPQPSPALRNRYHCNRKQFLTKNSTEYSQFLSLQRNQFWKKVYQKTPLYHVWHTITSKSQKYNQNCDQWRLKHHIDDSVGKLSWVVADLCSIPFVEENMFDAVISLSAVEHIAKEKMKFLIEEIERVTKPQAYWAITTSGTEKDSSWFHDPSQGWCYSMKDIGQLFSAQFGGGNTPEITLERYRTCAYLRKNLADFYKGSGSYGMPWGIWDPKYIPVGIYQK